jgi:hypothetical protein
MRLPRVVNGVIDNDRDCHNMTTTTTTMTSVMEDVMCSIDRMSRASAL